MIFARLGRLHRRWFDGRRRGPCGRPGRSPGRARAVLVARSPPKSLRRRPWRRCGHRRVSVRGRRDRRRGIDWGDGCGFLYTCSRHRRRRLRARARPAFGAIAGPRPGGCRCGSHHGGWRLRLLIGCDAAAIEPEAQRLQHVAQLLRRAAEDRHHVRRRPEAAVARRALRRRAGLAGSGRQAKQRRGSGPPAAPACRGGPRAGRTHDSRRRDRTPPGPAGSGANEVSPARGGSGMARHVEPVRGAVLQRPEASRVRRGRLQQGREVDIEGAEAHAVLAQLRPRRLIERADLLGHGLAPQRRRSLSLRRKAMPRASPAMSWAPSISTSGFSRSPMSLGQPGVSRSCTFSLSAARQGARRRQQ